MAVSGGATTAYVCWLDNDPNYADGLRIGSSQMVGGSLCVKPEDAVTLLHSGKSAIVAGSDMVELRKLLAAK